MHVFEALGPVYRGGACSLPNFPLGTNQDDTPLFRFHNECNHDKCYIGDDARSA